MKLRTRPAVVLAVLALTVTAGCKTSNTPHVATAQSGAPVIATSASPGPSPAADDDDRAIQFQQCMHDHGVELQLGKKGDPQVGPSFDPARIQAAYEACRAYASSGDGNKVKLTAEDIEKLRLFSQCVRDHGIEDWPDPDPETGEMKFADPGAVKTNPKLPAALKACQSKAPRIGAGG
ncbi:hypothetical protein [Hamadaea tsunoensis]|uniref:hypothetical protein n=1 Tax=Hamadaea tsunoensis TaxID=53368 RepID=UPI0012FB8139|nr:hypothetical protein [Hamadaea tsunoensis]